MYPGWQQNYMTYGGFQSPPVPSFQEPVPVPKPPLRVKLTPRERGSYNILLSQADPDGHNRVEGPQAVEFLKRSGLPTDVLRNIWNISTPEGESYLDRERFYVAMRLIALAQEGKSVSEQSIYDDIAAGIPKFQSNVVVKDKWDIENAEKEKYVRMFNSLSGGKGYLDTNEAINVFRETGVKSEYLKKIWNLSDPGDTGEFKENQFIVALHLASRVKNLSEPVPDELPAPLKKIMSAKPPEPEKPKTEAFADTFPDAFSMQGITSYPSLPVINNSAAPQFQTMPAIKINLDDSKSSMNSLNSLKSKQEEKKVIKNEEFGDDLLVSEPAIKIKSKVYEPPEETYEKVPQKVVSDRKSIDRSSLERKSIEGKVEIGGRKDEELTEQIDRLEDKIQKRFREWRDIRAKLSLEREKGQMLQTKLQEANAKHLKELSTTILGILED